MYQNQYLDHLMLVSSVVGMLGSIAMIVYMLFFMKIINIKPYSIFTVIFILGMAGIRFWRKESYD